MRTVQSVLRLALCFARCLAAPFPGTNQSLYHREREEDKEMAEFLQNKLSKSYLQKASRWLMSFIPPIEPPCQFLPSLSTMAFVHKSSLLFVGRAYLEAVCWWRRVWGNGKFGVLVLEIILWKHHKSVDAVLPFTLLALLSQHGL